MFVCVCGFSCMCMHACMWGSRVDDVGNRLSSIAIFVEAIKLRACSEDPVSTF